MAIQKKGTLLKFSTLIKQAVLNGRIVRYKNGSIDFWKRSTAIQLGSDTDFHRYRSINLDLFLLQEVFPIF